MIVGGSPTSIGKIFHSYIVYTCRRLIDLSSIPGGTSASSPAFSSMVSLLNEARLSAGKKPMGLLNPFLYQNVDAFTDVTVGSNKVRAIAVQSSLSLSPSPSLLVTVTLVGRTRWREARIRLQLLGGLGPGAISMDLRLHFD